MTVAKSPMTNEQRDAILTQVACIRNRDDKRFAVLVLLPFLMALMSAIFTILNLQVSNPFGSTWVGATFMFLSVVFLILGYRHNAVTNSTDEDLSKLLIAYVPIDVRAFSNLRANVSINGFFIDAQVTKWLDAERAALRRHNRQLSPAMAAFTGEHTQSDSHTDDDRDAHGGNT